MRRIFHHSSAFIAKHKRHHHLASVAFQRTITRRDFAKSATLALVIVGTGMFTSKTRVQTRLW